MRFWKNNRLDSPVDKATDDVVREWWASDLAKEWAEHGGVFERSFIHWCSTEYGSWDPTDPDENADFGRLLAAVWDVRPSAVLNHAQALSDLAEGSATLDDPRLTEGGA